MDNYFPPKGQDFTYLQLNRGDDIRSGSIWTSMGIDLQSNLGTMRVTQRMRIASQTSDNAQLGLPVAFEYFQGTYFAVCGAVLFKNTANANGAWTQDAETGASTDYGINSDLKIFAGLIWATPGGDLKSSDGGAWTQRDNMATSNGSPLCYFANVPGGRLYYPSGGSEIWSIDSAFAISDNPGVDDYCIDLIDFEPICIEATTDSIWIGVEFGQGSAGDTDPMALVLQWDGISNQLTEIYALKGAAKCQAIVIMNNVPYAMDSNGVLSKFTGYSFEEVGRLPFNPKNPASSFVLPNGMCVTENGTILVNVNNVLADNAQGIYENCPSGIWEWSEEFGFVHKNPFTYNTNANTTITDYGQNRIFASGAIFNATPFERGASGWNGQILAGASIYTNTSSTTSAIFFDDTLNQVQKKGYFVTTWYDAEEIQDKYSHAYTVYRRLLAPTDSVQMKFRVNEESSVYATITWVNTTTFTTTTDISAYAPTAPETIGGEVEIIRGTGGASCVHISSVTNNAGTYTVVIDEAVTGVTTGTATARFQKWIKLNPKNPQDQINSYSRMGIGASGTRIQFKVCMTFTGNGEFYKLAFVSNPDIKVTS